MKDLLIALAILLILVAVFSHTPQTQRDNTASGTQTKGESDIVQSKGDNFSIPEQSPQTGYRWWWF